MMGNASFARRIKLLLLVPILGVATYGIYKIVGIFFASTETFLDILITIFGIWSLILSIYIIPVIKGKYQPEYKDSSTDKIWRRFSDAKYSLWRGYQKKVRKDFGKAYAGEFERYGERLDKIRVQLSGVLLLPLGCALIVIPPLVLPLIALWLRSFTLDKKPLILFERVLLVVIMVGLMLLSTFLIVTLDVSSSRILFDFVYGLGILTSIIVLAYIVVSS
jgi:hypothetical protein